MSISRGGLLFPAVHPRPVFSLAFRKYALPPPTPPPPPPALSHALRVCSVQAERHPLSLELPPGMIVEFPRSWRCCLLAKLSLLRAIFPPVRVRVTPLRVAFRQTIV